MPAANPNLLLITTDQQRADTLPPDAPSFLRVPHLQHLQHEGTTFSRAYADNPICVPSRTSIMTGNTVAEHGMLHNGETSDHIDRTTSLPSRLRGLGYQTAAIGKMHFHPPRARHGFDEMLLPDDYLAWIRATASLTQPMTHGLGQNELHPTLATVPEGLTLTSWIAEQSLRYIRDRRDPTVPFFLWTSFSKPHPPLDPPEPYYSMYRHKPVPTPVVGRWAASADEPEALRRQRDRERVASLSTDVLTEARAAYYGLITQIDYNVGRILAGLQDTGDLADTLILFASDHGELLGDHNLVHKALFLEPAARVPFVLRPPLSWGLVPGGECRVPVTLADVLPTLVGAAGGDPPDGTEGRDLLAVLRDEANVADRAIEGMSAGYNADVTAPIWLGLTDGRWKYIWYPEGPAEQLFDLADDPGECHDLARDPAHTAVRAELHQRLVARHRQRGSPVLDGGELPRHPIVVEAATRRQAASWPGFHTETFDLDVKH